jgi:hypothetical protein
MEARGITRRIGGPSVGWRKGQKRSITISGEEAEQSWSCDCDRIGAVKSYMEHPRSIFELQAKQARRDV